MTNLPNRVFSQGLLIQTDIIIDFDTLEYRNDIDSLSFEQTDF